MVDVNNSYKRGRTMGRLPRCFADYHDFEGEKRHRTDLREGTQFLCVVVSQQRQRFFFFKERTVHRDASVCD